MLNFISKIFRIIKILGFATIILSLAGAQSALNENDIQVNSNKLTVDKIKNISYFEGAVVVIYEDMVLKTEKAEVMYKEIDGKSQIDKIIIPTHLEATKDKKGETLKADRGEFYVDEGKLKLLGNVLLTQQNNILKTKELVYYVKLKKK